MNWFMLIPILQSALGAVATALGPGGPYPGGVISAEVHRWMLLAAGLPLVVQVPAAAYMLNRTQKKADLALRALTELPLTHLHVDPLTRQQIRKFAPIEAKPPPTYPPLNPADLRPSRKTPHQ